MERFLMKAHCKEFKEAYNKVFLAALAKGEPYPAFFDVDTELYKKAGMMYMYNLQEELNLQKTAFLNNIGSSYEKEGNIAKAIEAYEECAAIGYKASHCYERLQVIYKKRNDTDNVARIVKRMNDVYNRPKSWEEQEMERYFCNR